MRADQIQRLQDLSEELADAFLLEADPREWPGQGKAPVDMGQSERGDRYWCKKNAMATGGVLKYTLDLLGKHTAGDPDKPAEDADLDKAVTAAERRAKQLVDAAVARAARKPEFDKRTHGR